MVMKLMMMIMMMMIVRIIMVTMMVMMMMVTTMLQCLRESWVVLFVELNFILVQILIIAAPARISACTCPKTFSQYFKQFPMQQSSVLLQILSGSDCPHENLFKIGLNSNTRQSSSATKDSHYFIIFS